jgi:hypothetical protein
MGGDSWMDAAALFTKYVACINACINISAFDFFVSYNLLHLKVEMSASCCTEEMVFFFRWVCIACRTFRRAQEQ